MREPPFWSQHTPTWQAHILSPFALLYGAGEAAHRFWRRPQMPSKPVICVGNFTTGGAGKTPTARWLAQWLKARGHNPAILSRGFGGAKTKNPIRIDASQIWQYNAAQIGDEPLLLAQDAPTYINANRHYSLRAAIKDGHDCAIKDDGFQNPTMRHCFNLVVVDAATGIGNGLLLPAGAMRQPLSIGLQKADALLVLGTYEQHPSLDVLLAQAAHYKVPVFRGAIKISADARPKRVFAYCGIAHPQKFYTTLEQSRYDVVGTQSFDDHHNFTEKQAHALCAKAIETNATLITTEKDYVRLQNMPPASARAKLAKLSETLPIHLQIENETALQKMIGNAIDAFHRPEPYTAY